MDRIVQKITSDSQEVKEAAKVQQYANIKTQRIAANTWPNKEKDKDDRHTLRNAVSPLLVDQESETSSVDLGDYYIARTIDAMEEWFSKPREGYHVTDAAMCRRQKVLRQIDRRPIGAKTISIYAVGKSIHEAVQLLYRNDKRTFEIEKYVDLEDIDLYIQGSVDIYDRRRNIPLEFKTTRASDIKEPKSFHVEQLKYYMSMLEAEEGYIIYQLLMHFGETPFKSFRITMNAQEREEQRDKLVKEIHSLKRAMESENPALAKPVIEDPDLNWMCSDCPYQTECKRIQAAAAAAAA